MGGFQSAIKSMNEFFTPVDKALSSINGVLYFPILVIILLGAGIYFTIRTKGVQFRLFNEAWRVVKEPSKTEGGVSGLGALTVSMASCVGSGNIVGVATAICIGGLGAIFWMWVTALVGMATAFIESSLAQVYKKRNENGDSYGGPSYYIETALHSRALGVIFAFVLILCYAVGFNMLASYNLQSAFKVFDFYNPDVTPWIIGGVSAFFVALVILGGNRRIIDMTTKLVPVMSIIYIIFSLIAIFMNARLIPGIFADIFTKAFDMKAVAGGMAGTALVQGIRRGLYSNEAGMGSAPNAAAAADTDHPAKQGLVQMLAVFIDTILICTATALMGASSGIAPSAEMEGSPWIQSALQANFGTFGPVFMVIALSLFVYSTFIGNLYYTESCVVYMHKKPMKKGTLTCLRIIACALVLFGATMDFGFAWDLSDLFQALMVFINIPCILILTKTSVKVLDDYTNQKKEGKNPVFIAKEAGIDDSNLEYWK